jgi:type IV pilus assembly protein PilN
MIRINLLSVREVRAEVGRRMEFVVAGLSLAVTFLLMLVVFLYQFYRSSSVAGELAALRAEIAGMEAQVKEVAELQKKVADVTQKNKVIEDLTKKKAGPVRVMESLSSAMPEKLWLTEFKETGGALVVTGQAIDNQTVADLLRAMQASIYFANVDLVESVQPDPEKTPFKKFSVKSQVLYQGAPPAPAGKPAPAGAPKPVEGKKP